MGEAFSQLGNSASRDLDPLGRSGQGVNPDQSGNLPNGDVYGRARELLDEIRRRSGEGDRPEIERNYLQRLLDRF